MKLTKLVLFAFMWPAISLAALNLPEPTALLNKAATSRTALLDSILAIEFNIPEMRDPATFDKYFMLMDDLKTMAQGSGLEEYYPDVVEKLALNMVSNGMRWLDVTKTDTAKLAFYIKWMDADSLARLLGLVEYQLTTEKNPAALKTMAGNLESVLWLIDQKAAKLPYVQFGFRRLMSDAAVNILKTENFTNQEFDFWVSKLKVSSAVSEYLDYLNLGVYGLDAKNISYSHIYLYRLTMMLQQTGNMAEVAPNWLLNAIADSASEVILRMVRAEENFVFGEFTFALEQLKTRHLQSLAVQWMSAEKLPSQKYIAHYLDLSAKLNDRLLAVGLRKESGELQKWLAKAAAPMMAAQMDIEGHYELYNKKGDLWYLTLAVAKENTLIAALGTKNGELYKTFFNVVYNLKTKTFVASEREPDSDEEQNPPIEFSVSEGKLTLFDPFMRSEFKTFVGSRIQVFADVMKAAKIAAPSLHGTYAGPIVLPNGKQIEGRLIVTSFNGYTLGRLDTSSFSIELNVGSEGDNGVVILTSGRKYGASWFQVRGVAKDGGLYTCVIVGGQGQAPACTLLKKVEDN